MTRFNKVTVDIVERLAQIVGEENLIHDDPDSMEPYSHDEVADTGCRNMPEVVVKPLSAAEVSEILKLANEELIPVTPRGAGSGLSGGAIPAYGGILLSTERMNRILEIDKGNLIAVVEPAVITNDLNRKLQEEGLFFAGYPMSLEMCYIGGNVAENAGGGRALKYGVTGRYITGLEVVMPTGEICHYGGKRIKDVTGFNMIQLMVGSEGTLGIFTKIMIKVLPLPKAKIDMFVLYPDIITAIKAVPLIMRSMRLLPTGIEFMDRQSIMASVKYLRLKDKYEDCGAMLIIELDGNSMDQIREECLDIGDLCLDHGALDAYVAEGPSDQEKIWRLRRPIAEALKAISPEQSLEDIVVPVNRIPDLAVKLEEIADKYGVLIPCYGHAGDGNLHATIIKKPEHTSGYWRDILPQLKADLYATVEQMGGTISGEHGIGSSRRDYLSLALGQAEIDSMKKIKNALDPNGILNPGKIFPGC